MKEIVYLLALKNVKGIGDIIARKLIKKFGSPGEVFRQGYKELVGVEGISGKLAESILKYSNWDQIRNEAHDINKKGIKILKCYDADYPQNLRNIYDYPLFLYYLGQIKEEDKDAIAVVGSRDCDDYGIRVTENIVAQLCEKGITVISGMARGIDTVAHLSAIKSGGRTVAVFGNGIDVCYPAENRELYQRISENGYVVSEYAVGTEPDSKNFPKRNRLISGLSKGVIVIQANRKSGALITADYACEQNREVFAVPGNINNRRNSGTNQLIKKGAKLVDSVNDVLEEIAEFNSLTFNPIPNKTEVPDIKGDEKAVFQQLLESEQHIDQIAYKTKIEFSKLFELLLNLELRGIIKSMPGNYYKACK